MQPATFCIKVEKEIIRACQTSFGSITGIGDMIVV